MGHRHGEGIVTSNNARNGVKYKPRLSFKQENRRRMSPSSSSPAIIATQGNKYYNFCGHNYSNSSQRSVFIKKERHQQGIQAPRAPRNTTSYIIRSKHMHSLSPVVTTSPFTPRTPRPSQYKEQFAEEVSEWGVNDYGSMNGLIRMKSGVEARDVDDVSMLVSTEAHSLELQRLDNDLNRFEMVYPENQQIQQAVAPASLEVRLVDQEYRIAALEEENMYLRERLRCVKHELDCLRSRMQLLEEDGGIVSSSCEQGQGEVLSEKSTGNI